MNSNVVPMSEASLGLIVYVKQQSLWMAHSKSECLAGTAVPKNWVRESQRALVGIGHLI